MSQTASNTWLNCFRDSRIDDQQTITSKTAVLEIPTEIRSYDTRTSFGGVIPTDASAVLVAHLLLLSAMRTRDDIDWYAHSSMLSFHDLARFSSTITAFHSSLYSMFIGSELYRQTRPNHESLRRMMVFGKICCLTRICECQSDLYFMICQISHVPSVVVSIPSI